MKDRAQDKQKKKAGRGWGGGVGGVGGWGEGIQEGKEIMLRTNGN